MGLFLGFLAAFVFGFVITRLVRWMRGIPTPPNPNPNPVPNPGGGTGGGLPNPGGGSGGGSGGSGGGSGSGGSGSGSGGSGSGSGSGTGGGTGTGTGTGGGGGSSTSNQPPLVIVDSPNGGTHPAAVRVQYRIQDAESDLTDLVVEFSPRPGDPFQAATEATGSMAAGSQGTSQLTSSPGGDIHVFVWDAATDLGALPARDVRLRFTPTGTTIGTPTTTPLFNVILPVVAPPPPPPPPIPWPFPPVVPASGPPTVGLPPRFNPDEGPRVPLRFTVADPESQPVDITVEYRIGTSGWTPATPAPNSDGLTRVPAPFLSANYRFIWDAAADLGNNRQGTAVLRLTVRRGTQVTTQETAVFAINTAPPEPPKPFAPKTPVVARIAVSAGDNQDGVRGQQLLQEMRVLVYDTSNRPIKGAVVSFEALPLAGVPAGTPTPLEILEHENGMTTTDTQGFASIRVRARKPDPQTGAGASATPVTAQIKATIVGSPGSGSTTFSCTIYPPKLVLDAPQTIFYGSQADIQIALLGRQNSLFVREYRADTVEPLRVQVTVTNGECSHRELVIPGPSGMNPGRVTIVPNVRRGTVQVEFRVPSDPSIAPVTHTFNVDARDGSRTTDFRGTTVRIPMRLHSVASGGGSTTGTGTGGAIPPIPTQVGWPGLTLSTPYKVEVTDGANTYTNEVTANSQGCQVSPTLQPLKIRWFASGGTVSTTQAPGTTADLDVEVSTPVYFTPSGPGPWTLRASVIGSVHDTGSVRILIPRPSGPPDCRHYHTFRSQGSLNLTFLIQQPAEPKLLDNNLQVVEEVQRGEPVRVAIDGLSPCTGTPDPIELESFRLGNLATPDYTGLSGYVRKQNLAMQRTTGPGGTVALRSVVGLPIAGDPSPRPASAWLHWVVPGGALRLSADGALRQLPVAKPLHRRERIEGSEVLQESIQDACPTVGEGASVMLPSGECRLTASDLDFNYRGASWTAGRTFRSQTSVEGPLGPGWSLEHAPRLEVLRTRGVRYFQPNGRYDDFTRDLVLGGETPPFGHHMALSRKTNITADESAYEITDAEYSVWHFNADGSLRFVKNRKGDKVSYSYNVKGELTRITDPHGREVNFSYTNLSGFPASAGPVRRLEKITDFANREVSYEYYPASDPAAGWLKKVNLPAVDTVLTAGGNATPNYKRSLTYTYLVDANDKQKGKLESVSDSVGTLWCTWSYDTQGRVEKTRRGPQGSGIEHSIDYTGNALLPREVEVTDPENNKTKWRFVESPHADAGTPDRKTEAPGTQLAATWETDHNTDGHLLRIKSPDGDEWRYAYDVVPPPGSTRPIAARRRGNLLSARQVATNGDTRTWRYKIQRPYNRVDLKVGPRGIDGQCESLDRTRMIFDDEVTRLSPPDPLLRPGNQGNVVKITAPRSQNMLVVPDASGGHQQRWVEGSPTWRFRFNSFGQVTWEMDPYHVVTEYEYYPDSTPTQGTPSTGGGGFVAKIRRDTTSSSERDIYLPNQPLNTIEVQVAYDTLGHITAVTDADGNTVNTETNDLHELVRVNRNIGVAGSTQPSTAERRMNFGIHGDIRKVLIPQPSATALAGGAQLEREVLPDEFGRPVESKATVTATEQARDRLGFDKRGRMISYDPPDQRSGVAPKGSSTVELDERSQTRRMNYGVDPSSGQSVVNRSVTHTAAGRVESVTDPGISMPATNVRNGFGESRGTVDPMGNTLRVERDAAGYGSRLVEQFGQDGPNAGARLIDPDPSDAPMTSYRELVIDEVGRVTREHRGHHRLDRNAAVANTPSSIEFVDGPQPWPPQTVPPGSDDGWGPGDGRATTDTMQDLRGQTARVVNDDLSASYMRRDAHGRPIEISTYEPRGAGRRRLVSFTKNTYSPGGDPIEVETRLEPTDAFRDQPVTLKEKREYDPMHRVVRTIDGKGNASRVEHDETGHVYLRTDPVGPDSTENYNGSVVNADGNINRFERDGMGQVRKVETTLTVDGKGGSAPDTNNPFNPSAKVGYSANYSAEGRMLSITDQANNTTAWRFDDHGRISHIDYASAASLGGSTSQEMKYEPNTGRMKETIDPNGSRKTYTYDDAGRTTRVDTVDPSGQAGGYTYEYKADRVVVTDVSNNSTLEMVYDSQGRLDQEIQSSQGNTHVVKSVYDGRGQRAEIEYPAAARRISYERDGVSRMRKIEEGGTVIGRYEYVGPEWISQRVHRGIGTRYLRQDGTGHLEAMEINGVGGGTINWALPPDRAGRIQSMTRNQAGASESKSWTYDSAGRVIREVYQPNPNLASSNLETIRRFDGDNVMREEVQQFATASGGVRTNTVNTQREERGRIVDYDGQSLSYDASGNLTNDGRKSFVWDAWGRLLEVKRSGQTIAEYTYDAMHRMNSRTVGGTREDFIYDGHHLIEVRQGSLVTERYIYSDKLDDIVEVELNGVPHVVLYSPTGHVEALVDDNGDIVERYDYDLSGRLTLMDANGNPITNRGPKCRMLFQRHYYDAEVGLYWFRQRWFHPGINSFMSADPLGFTEGPNLYGLTHGDPVNASDPFGMWSWGQVIGIAAAVVVGTAVTVATAGFAGPIVGASLATVIGGAVGGAAGGAVGSALESKIDTGAVNWGEVGKSAAVGFALGAAFSIGAVAAFSGPARAFASAAGARISSSFVGRAGASLAGVGRSSATWVAASRPYQWAASAGNAIGGPILNTGTKVCHQYGRMSQAFSGFFEDLGARAAVHIHRTGIGSRLAGRGVPIFDDIADDMTVKMWAGQGGQQGDEVYLARKAFRERFKQARYGKNLEDCLFDDMVVITRTDSDDLFNVARYSFGDGKGLRGGMKWGISKAGESADDAFQRLVPRSADPRLFAQWEAAQASLVMQPGSATAEAAVTATQLGGRRYFWPLWLSDIPEGLSGLAAALGVRW